MGKKFFWRKEYYIISLILILFIGVSTLSFYSIIQLQGNARVINYVGIVRGATQKLVKKELRGYADNALLSRLDSIIVDLLNGGGPNNLVVLHDDAYLNNMRKVREHWGQIKLAIADVREGKDSKQLYELSEEYFELVDKTVSSAEVFSEKQVTRSKKFLICIDGAIVIIIAIWIFYYLRAQKLKEKAAALDRIAYIDYLTQMPNRASCERQAAFYANDKSQKDLAVFMFDMNNLKTVNDQMGHQGGDRLIAEFGRILRIEGAEFGFVGRYGGDEFLGIFTNADERIAHDFLARVNEKVVAYNVLHINELEKISFAVGYCLANINETSLTDMIAEADRSMYNQKRRMKESKL